MKQWSSRTGHAAAVSLSALAILAASAWGSTRELGATTRVGAERVQVRVVMQGQRFSPARIVATVGDSVVFELQTGGPHNVAFDADSIPTGALAPLARNLGTEPRFLVTPIMLVTRGETFTLSLAGLPPGTYPFFCSPHLGNGMRGELVVTAR